MTQKTASEPDHTETVTYRKRDSGKLVYDVRKLLEEYASVELWGADMVYHGTVTDASDIWEAPNGRGAILNINSLRESVRPELVDEIVANHAK